MNSECAFGRRIDGERCPEFENAPRTIEGHAVMETLDRLGVWCRAGMSGTITGLDLNAAMGSLPDDIDRDFARRLFVTAEGPFCTAIWRQTDKEKENGCC
jgi:hypothetical protein